MTGFGKVTFKGEYFNQAVVNVLHYRSDNWSPLGGNPFDDVLTFVDAVIAECVPAFLSCLPHDYTLRTVEGVGYDDHYQIVTASPLIRTVGSAGTNPTDVTNGAATCAIISLRCGPQAQINGAGTTKRNRGYLAVGPLTDSAVDNYSHITSPTSTYLDSFAQHVAAQINVPLSLIDLKPIRIHEKWTKVGLLKILDWRTYSDVLGYRVNAVASYRKSRQPEA